MAPNKTTKIFAALFALIAWAGVALQFYTAIPSYLANGRTLGGTIVELLSFFTIQTNMLVAIAFTVSAFSNAGSVFFTRPGVLTSIAVNISIVALVYNLVLRATYHPVGLSRVSDETVHVLVPVLFIVYWLIAVPKIGFKWSDGLPWLWYPLFYLIYVLIRGAICGIYPYFFLDALKFGYPKVVLNITVLMVVFLLMDLFFIWIARAMAKKL